MLVGALHVEEEDHVEVAAVGELAASELAHSDAHENETNTSEYRLRYYCATSDILSFNSLKH